MAYKVDTEVKLSHIDLSDLPALSPEIARLREIALKTSVHGIPTLPLIDARSWSAHTDDEDWLIWRARRTAERLREMPLSMLPVLLHRAVRCISRP